MLATTGMGTDDEGERAREAFGRRLDLSSLWSTWPDESASTAAKIRLARSIALSPSSTSASLLVGFAAAAATAGT